MLDRGISRFFAAVVGVAVPRSTLQVDGTVQVNAARSMSYSRGLFSVSV